MQKKRKTTLMNLKEPIQTVSSYANYADEMMIVPIALNKRSPYEIIAHLMLWDSFVLKKRLPQILHGYQLEEKVDEAALIEKVQNYTRKNTPSEVFQHFIEVRKILVNQVEHLSEEEWYEEFIVRGTTMNLFSYIGELIKHDQHHLKQIELFLKN